MRNKQIEYRVTRLEAYRRHVEGTPPSRRADLIRELMRELAQPEGNESVMEAWCRYTGIDYDELRRRLHARVESVNELIVEPMNTIIASTELTPAAAAILAAIVEEQATNAAN